MEPEEKWNRLRRSVLKAAHILRIDLTERDIPQYGEWFALRRMNEDLWGQIRGRRK